MGFVMHKKLHEIYIYLSASQCHNVQSMMSEVHIKPLKCTMKVHDVVAAGDKLYTRKPLAFVSIDFHLMANFHPPAMDGLNRLWKVTHLN